LIRPGRAGVVPVPALARSGWPGGDRVQLSVHPLAYRGIMCARAIDPARADEPSRNPSPRTRTAPVVAARDSGVAWRGIRAAGSQWQGGRMRGLPVVTRRRVSGVLRLGLAAAETVALLGYFDYVLGFASFAIYNYFSYFTVQSGIAAVFVLTAAGLVALRHSVDPAWLDWIRLLVTSYMVVSGIVYLAIVIESSAHSYRMEVPWSTQLLHFWLPAIALVDWFTDSGKARLPWTTLAWVMLVPALWGAFTLARGAIVRWYPYFFLDPKQVSGPLESLLYCLVAVALFVGIAALLTWSSRGWRAPWSGRPGY
jgi:hypothetical protein